jgi:hypothetical protein
MAPCNAKTKLEKALALLSLPKPPYLKEPEDQKLDTSRDPKTWQKRLKALTGIDLTTCPNCGQGRLLRYRLIGSEATLAPIIWDSS